VRTFPWPSGRSGQTLALDIPAEATWVGDVELLRRSLLNLLGNASKYGPRGGRIDLAMSLARGRLLVQVRDQGPGVPDDMKVRVFDPLVRLERDSSHERSSSGLGLAFCHAVALAHHGRIWVEDRPNGGAIFCMELPAGELP